MVAITTAQAGPAARTAAAGLVAPGAASACELYPVALPDAAIRSARAGDVLRAIARGDDATSFAWLTWSAKHGAARLADSLTPPGDSTGYRNPRRPGDHAVSPGDDVLAGPDAADTPRLRAVLRRLAGRDITVPTADAAGAVASRATRRVAGFAVVRLRDARLRGPDRLTVRLRGLRDCAPQSAGRLRFRAEEDAPVIATVSVSGASATASFELRRPAHGRLGAPFAGRCGPRTAARGRTCTALVLYTPDAQFNGADRFAYTARNGARRSKTAQVDIQVAPVNDPPVASSDSRSTRQDRPLSLTAADLTSNDTAGPADERAQTLTVTAVAPTAASRGTVALAAGSVTYAPAPGFHGAETFTYTVCDDGTSAGRPDPRCADATLSIDVGAGRAPVAVDGAITTDEDRAADVALSASDPDGDPLTYAIDDGPQHGALQPAAGGQAWRYVPAADFAGSDRVRFHASDGALTSNTATVAIEVRAVQDPPTAGADSATTNEDTPLVLTAAELLGNDADPDGDTLMLSDVETTAASHGSVTLAPGAITYTPAQDFHGDATIRYAISDGAGNTARADVAIAVTSVDDPPVAHDDVASTDEDAAVVIAASTLLANDSDPDGAGVLSVSEVRATAATHGTVALAGGEITYTPAADFNGQAAFEYVVSDGTATATGTVSVTVRALPEDLPPDPVDVAPELPATESASLADSTEFLYSGDDPIQVGVDADTIEPVRAAVVRGRVLDGSGDALSGALVSVLDHPDYGHTLSRADGMFDLAVNGGDQLTVDYALDGYLPAQRQVDVPAQDFVAAEDVILQAVDASVTRIEPDDSEIQVASSSVVSDADGERQVTMMFEPGTDATMTLPDGSEQPLDDVDVRATEFTVGDAGPDSMPGDLPPASAYTYAVELSVDQALAAGATRVDFDKPVPVYVDNYLDMPVGTRVPLGYFDRERGVWVPSDDGRVIELLSTGASPEVDADGDGLADSTSQLDALGLDAAELERLATLHPAGTTLWRIQVSHFTPWDCNWPYRPPDDARAPDVDPDAQDPPDPDGRCEAGGCVITPDDQTLGERIGVAGTPFTLNYRSDRAPGRSVANTLKIPLSGSSPPASLRSIQLRIDVAGRTITRSFAPAPNLRDTFTWDGKDAYARAMAGSTTARVRVEYVYGAVYSTSTSEFTRSFGAFGDAPLTGNRVRNEISIAKEWTREVAAPRLESQASLGGWTLSAHHVYDPRDRTLHLGDGTRRSASGAIAGSAISTIAGTGTFGFSGDGGPAKQAQVGYPIGVAAAADGSVYFSDYGNFRVRRISPSGTISTVAGTGEPGFAGDGGPATDAKIGDVIHIWIAPDGSLYIADYSNNRIRRVAPDGIITTVAGTGEAGFSGDGGPATEARLNTPAGVALAPDGNLYIADTGNFRVRRVGPDGTITTIAGTGETPLGTEGRRFAAGDGGPATGAALYPVTAVPDGDGGLVIADYLFVRRVGPDGIITTIAGNGSYEFSGDGGPATSAGLYLAIGLAVDPAGGLYLGDVVQARVRRIATGGTITTVAGTGIATFSGDGGPAAAAGVLPYDVALGPGGSLYVGDSYSSRVRKIAPPWPQFTAGDIAVPSEDGRELYEFNASGRHVRTLDAITQATLLSFGYDPAGRLVSIEDVDGRVTTIERDAGGAPTAIVAPGGQRTVVALDGDGQLAQVVQPGGATFTLGYAPGGLLSRYEDPRGGVSRYGYDAAGRLIRDERPDGGVQTLSRTQDGGTSKVVLRTGAGRETTYRLDRIATGGTKRTVTAPDGTSTTSELKSDGTSVTTSPDGTQVTTRLEPDPRFGMLAPLSEVTTRTPAGLTSTVKAQREVTLTDPDNPLTLATLTDRLTTPAGTQTTTVDTAARTITHRSPEGRMGSEAFDAKGRIVGSETDGIEPVTTSRDAAGRPTEVRQGDRTTFSAYDAPGRLTSFTDPLGRPAAFTYDAADRLTEAALSGGRQSSFGFDAAGNATSITPPARPSHTFSYTPLDLVQTATPPDVGTGPDPTAYAYDHDGRATRVSRPGGRDVTFGYDASGRLAEIAQARGTTSIAYDPATGKTASRTAPGAERVAYAYDGWLPIKDTISGTVDAEITRSFDTSYRLSSEAVDATAPVGYAYDADSRVTRAGDLQLVSDPASGLLRSTTLGAIASAWTYDPFGGPATMTASHAGGTVFAEAVQRDKLGRITSRTDTRAGASEVHGYEYDLAGRLHRVTRDGAVEATYDYDPNGNRTSFTRAGAAFPTTASHDDQDRLLRQGDATYRYTAAGDLREKTDTSTGASTTYEYDDLGALTGAVLPDGGRIDYAIDAGGRRIAKRRDGQLVQGFVYGAGLGPIAELDPAGAVESRFVYATRANVPDYMSRDGASFKIVTDHLGSPRAVVDVATGDVVQEMDYDEYGRVIRDTNPGFQPFGFAGGLYDRDTGLVRFGARDYDADVGRWTARDPIGFARSELNLYEYGRGDPVNRTDLIGASSADDGWGGGITLDLSTINPWTSGGGGSWGYNLQYLSTGPNAGWHLYRYYSVGTIGVNVGLSCALNLTRGNGEWTGGFLNGNVSVGKTGGQYFQSSDTSNGTGWYGVGLGPGAGLPWGGSASETIYELVW